MKQHWILYKYPEDKIISYENKVKPLQIGVQHTETSYLINMFGA